MIEDNVGLGLLYGRSRSPASGQEPQELTLVGDSPGDFGAPEYRDKRHQ